MKWITLVSTLHASRNASEVRNHQVWLHFGNKTPGPVQV